MMAGYTYDLVLLHAQVKDVLRADQSFCIELEVWDRRRLGTGLDVEVSIWDGSQHFRGATPDEAVMALLRHYGEVEVLPEDLGLVAVPTGPPVVEYGGSPMDHEG